MTSLVLRYGMAVLSVSIVIGLGSLSQLFIASDVELAFCLFAVAIVKPVDFHEFVNAIKELGIFWAIINEPPPGSVKKIGRISSERNREQG
jgi:hypothetical protein